MYRLRRLILTILSIVLLVLIAGCAGVSANQDPVLPFDPQTTKGTLENGLTYFIRENHKPEDRISLRLFVNAGSVLEDDDQQGIAHLLEHMAFDGSAHFAKHELEQFLESLGMEFGPDLNAYTSFDETVYQLEIPADDPKAVEKGFLVLQDWAKGLTLDPAAIDEERRVVREEWRLKRGAQARIRDAQIPKLLEGSRYAKRIPIGDMEDVMHTPASRVKDFYTKWYRPDLMAVAVAGDIDPKKAEDLIKRYFSYTPSPAQAVAKEPRPEFSVPLSQKNEALVLTDPELTVARAQIMTKLAPRGLVTVGDYKQQIREILFWNMLNSRLEERTKEKNPPFMRAGGSSYPYVRNVEVSYLTARGKPEEILKTLDALLTEARRVQEYGFTPSELKRESARVLKAIENAYKERSNRDSNSIVKEMGDYFLNNVGMPGIAYEYKLFQEEVPRVQLAEVNALSSRFFPPGGRLITLSLPQTDNPPTEQQVLKVGEEVASREIAPYKDNSLDAPLIPQLPPQGTISSTRYYKETDTTVLTLSNGMRIAVKPTDFQENRVQVSALSPGGESLVATADLPAARTAALIRQESGFGAYSASQLDKYLADKDVSLKEYIGRFYEGFNGEASSGDLEYLFQLVHLIFTAPRFDGDAFDSVRQRISTSVANRDKSPQTIFTDTLYRLLADGSPRREPFTLDTVQQMDLGKSEKIYRERFGNPADFTVTVVGKVDMKELSRLAETYLASLPSAGSRETPKDTGVRPADTPVTETVRKGIENKASEILMFTRPMNWSQEESALADGTASILQNILGEKIREDMGGTYSISAWSDLSRLPYEHAETGIYFGSDPARLDELTAAILKICADLAQSGPDERYIKTEEETYRRNFEENMKENSFWLDYIQNRLRDNKAPNDLLTPDEYDAIIDSSSVSRKAGELLRPQDLIEVRLLPDSSAGN